jgi:hypothetical protein
MRCLWDVTSRKVLISVRSFRLISETWSGLMRIQTQWPKSQESTDACTSLSEQLEVFSRLLCNMKWHHPIYKSSADLYQLNLVRFLIECPSKTVLILSSFQYLTRQAALAFFNPVTGQVVAHRVGRGTALLFHDRGARRWWLVSNTPQPKFTHGKDPVPIAQEAG